MTLYNQAKSLCGLLQKYDSLGAEVKIPSGAKVIYSLNQGHCDKMQYNEIVTFGSTGSAKTLNPLGFDFSDTGNTSWTVVQNCQLEVILPLTKTAVSLEIEAFPFVYPDKIPGQQVFVYLNGLFQCFNTFKDYDKLIIPIQKSAMSSRANTLSFVLPTATSPKALGISDDVRNLGLAFISICFASK